MVLRQRLSRPVRIAGIVLLLATLLLSVTALVLQKVQTASAASANYNWKQGPKIGGGGFVTGIAFHPTDPTLKFVRTDVGGAYRWDPKTKSWSQLLLSRSVPNFVKDDYNVESIAESVSKPGLLFIASGADAYRAVDAGQGRILKSLDGGKTFTEIKQRFWMDGNGDGRQGSERLAVDPKNSSTVYFGTRKQGLWISSDEGVTWKQVPLTTLPAGGNLGVEFVRVDPNGPVVNGKIGRVYASVDGQGIYRTDDAGATWRKILDTQDLGFSNSIASDGTLYVGFGSSVQKYDPTADKWTPISPNTTDGSWQVAVSPADPKFVFAAPGGLKTGTFFRSNDGGATWTGLAITASAQNVPWVAATNEIGYFSTAALAFDPIDPTTIFLAQGTGIWTATNLSAAAVTWVNISVGIEEMVTTDLIAPPGGAPVTNVYDRQGFYHANVDAYPDKPLVDDQFAGGTGLDYSGGNPNFLVTVQARNNSGAGLGRGAYSTNGGRSWTLFPKQPPYNSGGNVAVSATDPNNIVWLPSTGNFGEGHTPYYTVDRAKNWGTSAGIDSVKTHWLFWWGSKRALESDKVVGATFYVMTFDNNGTFYVSRDGGNTFTKAANSPTCTQDGDCHVYGQLHAAPGYANNLWSSAGKDGLWYTTDAGATAWHKVAGVQEARSFGFGKAFPGSKYPAIYLYGKANGETTYGIWRSADQGASWVKVAGSAASIYDQVNVTTGDMNLVGRVYVGFNGNGFVYGDDYNYVKGTANKAVKPVLECVRANGDSTYTAWFGTQNDNDRAVTVPVGANNGFTPAPQDRGQLVTFAPGRQQRSFSVVFDGTNLVWTLKGPDGQARTATASASSSACTFTPTPTPTMLPQPSVTATLPPAKTPMIVYADAAGDGWFRYNFSSDVNFASTDVVHGGTASIAATYTSGFGAVAFGRWQPPVETVQYGGISLWVNGGATAGTRQLRLYSNTAADGTGTQSPDVLIDAPANTWTKIDIPFSALGNPEQIGLITIGDRTGGAQPTLYIDDITFTVK